MMYTDGGSIPTLGAIIRDEWACPWPSCKGAFETHARAVPDFEDDRSHLRVAGFCRESSHESDINVVANPGKAVRLVMVPRPDRFLWFRSRWERWAAASRQAFDEGRSLEGPGPSYDLVADRQLLAMIGGSPYPAEAGA